MKLLAKEIFNIVKNIAQSYLHDLISLKPSTYDFRSEKQVQLPKVNSNRYGLRSFRYEVDWIWNNLDLAEQFWRMLQALYVSLLFCLIFVLFLFSSSFLCLNSFIYYRLTFVLTAGSFTSSFYFSDFLVSKYFLYPLIFFVTILPPFWPL